MGGTARPEEQPGRSQVVEDLPVGGQAVIEGVMMRVPGRIVTAVRHPSGDIVIDEQPYVPLSKRVRWLGVPVVRGAVSFVEMMVIGFRALTFSADVAMEEEAGTAARDASKGTSWRDQLALYATLIVAFALGIGLFFFLPLVAAQLTGVTRGAFAFNLVAGAVRATLLVLYMWSISRWGEIQRVFQYHGAEHKSIYALEAGADLTVEGVRPHSRFHPRCGTSFVLIVVLLAILVFAIMDTLFVVVAGRPQGLLERFATHVSVLPLIGGIGFELLKLSGRWRATLPARLLMAPGLWLQRITTAEPDASQMEVALAALRRSLAASGDAALAQRAAAAAEVSGA